MAENANKKDIRHKGILTIEKASWYTFQIWAEYLTIESAKLLVIEVSRPWTADIVLTPYSGC